MTPSKIVIIGGGNAGMQVADSLRKGGHIGTIDILCEENHLPYQRPPLSKKFLEGALEEKRLHLRPATYYETKNITLHLGTTATSIDRAQKQVKTSTGGVLAYDKLVLATGARVRVMPKTTPEQGLLYIRTIDDVGLLKTKIDGEASKKVVMIGGGFIGLETAATLRTLGHEVTVIEAMPHIMPGLVAPVLSTYFKEQHTAHGVTIIDSSPVRSVFGSAGDYTLELASGKRVSAEIVIVGIGVIPNSELAEDAYLTMERGILVDAQARTSDPCIYAAGDCANGMHMRFGTHTRLESVQNAADQSAIVAKSILGESVSYDALPWFWSDQYDMKLQMAGLSRGHTDYVVRGDMASGKFSICYFKDSTLIAVDSLNAVPDHMAARRLLTAGIFLTKEQCEDAETPLKAYLQ